MADNTKHYVMRGDKSLTEGMTKEEVLTAIVNAVEQGEIGDIDTGFVTSIKEQNGGQPFTVWIGTEAQYQAIVEKERNRLYLISDDQIETDFEQSIDTLNNEVNELKEVINKLTENVINGETQSSTNKIVSNNSRYSSYTIVAEKIGRTITIYGYFVLGQALSAPSGTDIVDIAKLLYGSTPSAEEIVKTAPRGTLYVPVIITRPDDEFDNAYVALQPSDHTLKFFTTDLPAGTALLFSTTYQSQY